MTFLHRDSVTFSKWFDLTMKLFCFVCFCLCLLFCYSFGWISKQAMPVPNLTGARLSRAGHGLLTYSRGARYVELWWEEVVKTDVDGSISSLKRLTIRRLRERDVCWHRDRPEEETLSLFLQRNKASYIIKIVERTSVDTWD